MFTNDLYPRIHRHVEYPVTLVQVGAGIGSGATIIGGVTIGRFAVVGAGAVVTRNVEDFSIYAGNPARCLKRFDSYEKLFEYMQVRQKTSGELPA